MDFENFFYVILAVIYFLSRFLKGRKQAPREDESYEQPEDTGKKPVTFEDLLREFTQEKEQQQPSQEVTEVEVVEEEPFRPARESSRKTYQSPYSDEESKSIFERSIREAKDLAKTNKQSTDDKSLVFKEFKPYQEEEESNLFATELKEMLQSGDGGKKAIILSEILNRRY